MTDFKTLGLDPRLIARLDEMSLSAPTPIQARAIPLILEGRDVMGLAQTGTGKTAAFGLPLIQMLTAQRQRPAPGTAHALILAPTRELAKQIEANLALFARGTPTRITVVTGGASLNAQADRLSRGVDILVATPGRLIDLIDRRAASLAAARFLVLDEADHMLDMGFIHALRRIARLLPEKRQTLLFSATMPKLMAEVAASYLHDPVRIEVAPAGRPAEKIEQGVHFVSQGDKAKVLEGYLDRHRDERAIVFARTKHGAEKLMKLLDSWGFAAGSIHGNKSQGQRDRALAQFRAGELRVLVATDVAARGIDIPLVRHVYNHDLPNVPENYVHRIGRTARAGEAGRALTL
ncbi:MAG: DEAD/DEAH box helicase, partial [Rhodobacteraceae bacterium]|nr:DEAD/DEAH box helicase [Paracoccaceae bacterium]